MAAKRRPPARDEAKSIPLAASPQPAVEPSRPRYFVGRKALLTSNGVRDVGAEVAVEDVAGGLERVRKLVAAGVLVER